MLSNLGYTKVRPKRLVMATHVHQYHGGGSLALVIYAHYALVRERERKRGKRREFLHVNDLEGKKKIRGGVDFPPSIGD